MYTTKDLSLARLSLSAELQPTNSSALLDEYFCVCQTYSDTVEARATHSAFISQVTALRNFLFLQTPKTDFDDIAGSTPCEYAQHSLPNDPFRSASPSQRPETHHSIGRLPTEHSASPSSSRLPSSFAIIRNTWGFEYYNERCYKQWNAFIDQLTEDVAESVISWVLNPSEASSRCIYDQRYGMCLLKWNSSKEVRNYVDALHMVINAPLSVFYTPLAIGMEVFGIPVLCLSVAPLKSQWENWDQVYIAWHSFNGLCASLRLLKSLKQSDLGRLDEARFYNNTLMNEGERKMPLVASVGSDARWYFVDARALCFFQWYSRCSFMAARVPRREMYESIDGCVLRDSGPNRLILQSKLRHIVNQLLSGSTNTKEVILVSTLCHQHGVRYGSYIYAILDLLRSEEKQLKLSIDSRKVVILPNLNERLKRCLRCMKGVVGELLARSIKRLVQREWRNIPQDDQWRGRLALYRDALKMPGTVSDTAISSSGEHAIQLAAPYLKKLRDILRATFFMGSVADSNIGAASPTTAPLANTNNASGASGVFPSSSGALSHSTAAASPTKGGVMHLAEPAVGSDATYPQFNLALYDVHFRLDALKELEVIVNDLYYARQYVGDERANEALLLKRQPHVVQRGRRSMTLGARGVTSRTKNHLGDEEGINVHFADRTMLAGWTLQCLQEMLTIPLVIVGEEVDVSRECNYAQWFHQLVFPGDAAALTHSPLRSRAWKVSIQVPLALRVGSREKILEYADEQDAIGARVVTSSYTDGFGPYAERSIHEMRLGKFIQLHAADLRVACRGWCTAEDYHFLRRDGGEGGGAGAAERGMQGHATSANAVAAQQKASEIVRTVPLGNATDDVRSVSAFVVAVSARVCWLNSRIDVAEALAAFWQFSELAEALWEGSTAFGFAMRLKVEMLARIATYFAAPRIARALDAALAELDMWAGSIRRICVGRRGASLMPNTATIASVLPGDDADGSPSTQRLYPAGSTAVRGWHGQFELHPIHCADLYSSLLMLAARHQLASSAGRTPREALLRAVTYCSLRRDLAAACYGERSVEVAVVSSGNGLLLRHSARAFKHAEAEFLHAAAVVGQLIARGRRDLFATLRSVRINLAALYCTHAKFLSDRRTRSTSSHQTHNVSTSGNTVSTDAVSAATQPSAHRPSADVSQQHPTCIKVFLDVLSEKEVQNMLTIRTLTRNATSILDEIILEATAPLSVTTTTTTIAAGAAAGDDGEEDDVPVLDLAAALNNKAQLLFYRRQYQAAHALLKRSIGALEAAATAAGGFGDDTGALSQLHEYRTDAKATLRDVEAKIAHMEVVAMRAGFEALMYRRRTARQARRAHAANLLACVACAAMSRLRLAHRYRFSAVHFWMRQRSCYAPRVLPSIVGTGENAGSAGAGLYMSGALVKAVDAVWGQQVGGAALLLQRVLRGCGARTRMGHLLSLSTFYLHRARPAVEAECQRRAALLLSECALGLHVAFGLECSRRLRLTREAAASGKLRGMQRVQLEEAASRLRLSLELCLREERIGRSLLTTTESVGARRLRHNRRVALRSAALLAQVSRHQRTAESHDAAEQTPGLTSSERFKAGFADSTSSPVRRRLRVVSIRSSFDTDEDVPRRHPHSEVQPPVSSSYTPQSPVSPQNGGDAWLGSVAEVLRCAPSSLAAMQLEEVLQRRVLIAQAMVESLWWARAWLIATDR